MTWFNLTTSSLALNIFPCLSGSEEGLFCDKMTWCSKGGFWDTGLSVISGLTHASALHYCPTVASIQHGAGKEGEPLGEMMYDCIRVYVGEIGWA